MNTFKQIRLAKVFLRLGLAFVFVYAALEIHLGPANFLKYVPDWVSSRLSVGEFLPIFGALEMGLATWVLCGLWGRVSSMLTFLALCAITIPNYTYFPVLFRNVAIATGALALFCLEAIAVTIERSQDGTAHLVTPAGDVLHRAIPPSQVYPPTTIGKI